MARLFSPAALRREPPQDRRAAPRRRWRHRARLLAGVLALMGGTALAVSALPGAARAGSAGYDQITGFGPTASAVTVPWTQGLLDNTNTPIPSANADRTNRSSSLWFMYQDFQTLTVTVSQTQDIGHQSVTVSWSGALPTVRSGGQVDADYLQMMECYGDASTGPTPEQCEYGTTGLLPNGAPAGIASRTGDLCTSSTPSTSNPPGSLDGTGTASGCDPAEPSAPSHLAPCPGTFCNPDSFDIPFDPVTDTNQSELDYAEGDTTYYSKSSTDEVQEAVTGAAGTGQQQFATLTSVQAPGLGCGQAEAGGSARGCWLVIVPRGEYEPNGYDTINKTTGADGTIVSSPLSATNWAQRIQIHLGFAPVASSCPPGTPETQTVGTQLVARAIQSWQLALNQAANCTKTYGYSAAPEATSTQLLSTPGSDVGLAFTTIPIGSEATRSGGSPPANLPTILYAPVAIAALDFGFNINIGTTGYVTTPVKLTPLLLAKALTQSYRQDLPDYYPAGGTNSAGALNYPGPTWAQGNPLNISGDPTFQTLNPEIPSDSGGPLAPLLTQDHSALNQQIWQWVQSSTAATTWLGGTPDATDGNMQVDPAYQALTLGNPPAIDSFPRAYSACLNLGPSPGFPSKQETKCSLDLLPYTDSYDSAAAAVLTANDPDANGPWDPSAIAPDGTLGWWDKEGAEPLGQIWMWAASDTPDLAAYGLTPAQLCNDSATTCAGPSTASVTAAVNAATPDTSGLLEVNPANPGPGGYPLTQIIYAAVATNQSAAALSEDANLIAYAAGTGQTPGTAAGDLPPGYLPLPASLVSQARAVVAELRTTTTSLTASANPATVGQTVTLTATETAADGTHPAGSVQFEVGGTAIGAPVAVTPAGAAATTISFGSTGTMSLSAVFTPAGLTDYGASTGAYTETVQAAPPNSGIEPLTVTVPASGSFTLTVATGTVTLTVSGSGATGVLNPVTVSDTRNTFPGWSVSGQESDFAGSGTAAGYTFSGNQLGWVPTDTALGTGVTLGGTVTPAAPGLGTTAAVLAQAAAPNGSGTSVLGANLTLAIPATAAAGPYTGSLTITAVTSLL